PRHEFFREMMELFVETGAAQLLECHDARAHTQRTPRKRARLIDSAERRNLIHDFGAAAVGCHWKPAADDLAERSEVGFDVKKLLCQTKMQPEARNRLARESCPRGRDNNPRI